MFVCSFVHLLIHLLIHTVIMCILGAVCQGAVPKGSAMTENLQKLGYKDGDIVYKCNKCLCIKPDRTHHCRSDIAGDYRSVY